MTPKIQRLPVGDCEYEIVPCPYRAKAGPVERHHWDHAEELRQDVAACRQAGKVSAIPALHSQETKARQAYWAARQARESEAARVKSSGSAVDRIAAVFAAQPPAAQDAILARLRVVVELRRAKPSDAAAN